MSDVLSQEEIDNLLAALNKGELSAEEIKKEKERKKIKTYDFSKPTKFSKDQIRTFEMIHENFSRALSTYLSGRTRSLVNINLVSIDQITYNEFIRSVSNPTFMVIFTAKELKGSSIIEINLNAVFTIIDRLLGGPGIVTGSLGRSLTDIEVNIMKREVSAILGYLKEAWLSFLEFTPEIEAVETNPQFVQIAPPNEMVLLITFDLTIGQVESFMNICWLSSVLEPFAPRFSSQMFFTKSSEKSSPENIELIKKNMLRTKLEVSALLGKSVLTLGELLQLQVGDVIRLNTKVGEEIDVLVQGIPKFKGIPGKRKDRKVVKVTKICEETIDLVEMLMNGAGVEVGGEK